MATVDISNIEKVYSGKRGCMCGCKGKYSYNEGAKFESWQANAPNVRSVKIIAGKVLNHPNRKDEDNMSFVEDEERDRLMVVYYK
jgi:hypothetical protein